MIALPLRTIAALSACFLLFLCAALPASAADPFAAGSLRGSLLVGNGYAFDESYVIIGVGAGYFVAKGFELGLDGEWWTSGTPGISKITPGVRYIIPSNGAARPYMGAFYRRTMIENYKDLDSAGGRAGVYFLSGKGSYFGIGGVYEKHLSCTETVYRSCSEAYPEIIFAIAF